MDGLVIGLDLNDDYTRISCYDEEKSWTIPTVICRKKQEEVWLAGEEAYACTLVGEGVIVDKLLKMVRKDGTSTIGGIRYTGRELLNLFVRKMLEYPMKEFRENEVDQLVISLQQVDAKMTDTLMYCADFLGIPREKVHVISHMESFVYYVLSQKKDLWTNQVGLFDLSNQRLCYYEMKVQRGLRRNMVQADSENMEEAFNLDILDSPSGSRLADRILCSCGERLLSKKLFSSIFLTGKGFDRTDWAGEFMKLVCHRKKVFAEPVLFARGAAYKGADCRQSATSYPYIFICEGRLKTEVSMRVVRGQKEGSLVLASYGDNWYESKSTMDFILDDQNEIEFTITPLDSKKKKLVRIPLTGFPKRPPRTTRIQMSLAFLDERTMVTVIRDKGFGELFPASDAVIKQEVTL
ncbi:MULTISPECIES: DUF5716 family protein [Enterocloster]|uniref:DUF5716 domain-containing protein n=1 Tax=Enterocloster lavalensis TaxID=460384 RepID=A0A1I0C551_9FIRM|nr:MULTISPECIES: DUF5716 family protein [Enterocloster]MCB6342236.1 DUF5716 family protein [Enterocloster lavalensis]MDR3755578.1 DUF5716 family protein [Enterocloster sp.]SET14654.1 hypothetical protein SAMN05216313_102307 [Enterocloster lavalensis]